MKNGTNKKEKKTKNDFKNGGKTEYKLVKPNNDLTKPKNDLRNIIEKRYNSDKPKVELTAVV